MSLLDEAIVDAITLKEAALKNAEAMVLEKYSVDVRQALENLLNEQEDLGASDLGVAPTVPNIGTVPSEETNIVDDLPFAFKDRNSKGIQDKEKLCDNQPCPEDEEQVEIPLKNIAEALNIKLNRVQKDTNVFEVDKNELLNVFEELTVDARVVPHGHVYLATQAEIEHAFDIVSNPSTYGAFINENKETVVTPYIKIDSLVHQFLSEIK